jgi:hypothetical protein
LLAGKAGNYSNGVFQQQRRTEMHFPEAIGNKPTAAAHKENGYICFAADTRFIIKGPATTLACYLFIARSIPLAAHPKLHIISLQCAARERREKRGETESIIQTVFGSVCLLESEAVNQLDNGFNFAFPLRALPNERLVRRP